MNAKHFCGMMGVSATFHSKQNVLLVDRDDIGSKTAAKAAFNRENLFCRRVQFRNYSIKNEFNLFFVQACPLAGALRASIR